MLTLAHAYTRSATISADPDACRDALAGFMTLMEKVSDVHVVEPYPDDIYRIILRKLGGSVGMLSYGVHVAFDLRFETFDGGVRAVSLPRDPQDSWIGDGILLADYRSETRYRPDGDSILLEHEGELRIDIPLPSFLSVVPMGIVQGIGDGIVRTKTDAITEEMLGQLLRVLR